MKMIHSDHGYAKVLSDRKSSRWPERACDFDTRLGRTKVDVKSSSTAFWGRRFLREGLTSLG